MEEVTYQVLLPKKLWEVTKDKDELKKMIENYFSVGYPHYEIQRIIKSGQAYVTVCTRR
ncbi:hypothetical protein CN285_24525 [Bacillus cereus]|uniref:hypothetical protein n=1 Tax=Bacillus paramycoides TaxID=2026194 RepID=UPI000BF6A5D6|nr:hypothetical protein [Bacillus paramycoides]PFD35089.1 hypothetical protein CN285_24525 [Bacillus cereus]